MAWASGSVTTRALLRSWPIMIGGMLLVGVVYWFVYLRPRTEA